MKRILNAFTRHPADAGETYFQHLLFTFGITFRLLTCAFMLLVHGIAPFLFVHGASKRMKECNDILCARAEKTKHH